MRELPELQTICARALGAPSCSVEVSFSKIKSGEPSLASRLLRSFKSRDPFPIKPSPCIGPGSSRRENAHDVDMVHPFISYRAMPDDAVGVEPPLTAAEDILKQPLLMQYGNPALDSLQTYIDTLVELGRMDDARLGVNFWTEWKTNVSHAAPAVPKSAAADEEEPSRPSKKRRTNNSNAAVASAYNKIASVVMVGSLSLHNCSIAHETVAAFVKANVGPHVAVLDLTGIRGLTDDLVITIVATTPNLQRISLKNCRKLTNRVCDQFAKCPANLSCIDFGGCFNITALDVLQMIPAVPNLLELHASGLQWSDQTLRQLVEIRSSWIALSIGFSPALSQAALRETLLPLAPTLEVLALPFCESVVDNALLGILGRNMPNLRALDLRGNPALNTVTGFYDGRVSANHSIDGPLVILGRYSGLSAQSVEETKRNHPRCNLAVILDGGGMGAAILRNP